MQSIWVRINGLKYSFWKQKAIGIVKTFKNLEFKLLDGILHIEKHGITIGKKNLFESVIVWGIQITQISLHFDAKMLVSQKWLARLISLFICSYRMIVNASSHHHFYVEICTNKVWRNINK